MKFDSYARFVKSPLYQECMLSEVEGRPLPTISSSFNNLTAGCSAFDPGAIKVSRMNGIFSATITCLNVMILIVGIVRWC